MTAAPSRSPGARHSRKLTPMDRSDIVGAAIEALNSRDFDLPLEAVDRALRIAPGDYRLWHVKGLMHREQERRELAIPALGRASELAPADPLVAHGYARTLFEAGLPSVMHYATAVKLAPDNPEVVKGLAAALVAEGRVDDAIAGLEGVIGRSRLWSDGHTMLADLRWMNGEREGFARSFEEALQAHPRSLELRWAHMTALLHAEQFDEIREQVKEGEAILGQHALFVSFEAAVCSETGSIDAADRLFHELTLFHDANSNVRHVRHLLRSGRAEQALPILDKWLGTDDRHMFWPSATIAWRLTGDPRAEWLEGDGRLIGVYDIGDQLPPLDRVAAILGGLHKVRGQPLSQSVRGGTQTDGNLFHRIEPEIVVLREAVRRTVAIHAEGLPADDPTHPIASRRPGRIRFAGAWSVRLAAGGHHTNHVHSQGWLSSALYIAVPDGLDAADRPGWLTLGEPDATLATRVSPRQTIEPTPGRLVLFPSWMWHGTRPFPDGTRLTVAFDVMPARRDGG